MQIPRILLTICVAAMGMSSLQAQKADTPDQAKAREQVRKKMAELEAKQAAPSSSAATKSPQSPAPVRPVTSTPKAAPASTTPLSPGNEARARAALRQEIAALNAADKATKSSGVTWESDPIAAAQPPIPPAVSGAKEQKLSELLTLYRANVISPEQYQKMRADILAQP